MNAQELRRLLRHAFFGMAFSAACVASLAAQSPSNPNDQAQNPRFETTVVVTADRTEEKRADAPSSVVVISGDTLESRGVRTLADALTFLPGLEVAHGADDGPMTGGVALWGLREFDAYALVVDGVPVGGTYNPNTAFVPIEEIDRIEVQKGPNAVLYGQTAFAGVIQVFTKAARAGARGFVAGGGGSLGTATASVSTDHVSSSGQLLRLSFSARRSSGWQARAGDREERAEISYARPLAAGGQMRITGRLLDRTQGFGSPVPRKGANLAPGVDITDNYAVRDARIADRIAMATLFVDRRLGNGLSFVNTSSIAFDRQARVRGFLDSVRPLAHAVGSSLFPDQLDIFEDAHLEWSRTWGERSSLLQAGGSYQFGRLEAESRRFEYTVSLARPNPPRSMELPAEDAQFFNRRDFGGAYVHEQLALNRRLTVSSGVRLDVTRERQRVTSDELRFGRLNDHASHAAASYKAAATVHLSSAASHYANVFVAFNHAFKPAAVNFAEPESVGPILKPEVANAIEGGLKAGALNGRVDFEASVFHMTFKNLVVSQVRSGQLVLLNAGGERFQGVELSATIRPAAGVPLRASAGYSWHRPIFTAFRTVNDEGELLILDGKTLELAPRHLITAQVDYGEEHGLGFFGALHGAGRRPVNRRNTFFAPGYLVADAGISYGFGRYRLMASLFNLTDSRHIVAESELADAQVYLSPPRRFSVELRVRF